MVRLIAYTVAKGESGIHSLLIDHLLSISASGGQNYLNSNLYAESWPVHPLIMHTVHRAIKLGFVYSTLDMKTELNQWKMQAFLEKCHALDQVWLD